MPRGKDKTQRKFNEKSLENLHPRTEKMPGYESLNVRFYVPQATARTIRAKDAIERGQILHEAVQKMS